MKKNNFLLRNFIIALFLILFVIIINLIIIYKEYYKKDYNDDINISEGLCTLGSFYDKSYINTIENDSLKIASFNIERLGKSKMSKLDVVDALITILNRYDIVFIQEIVDKDEVAIKVLLSDLNAITDQKFSMLLSSRLGRSSYKEQYAFFYRKDKINLKGYYQYEDTKDLFAREPFSGYFEYNGRDFSIVGIHVKPDDAVSEISSLSEVLNKVSEKFSEDEIILLGDLNSDCSYFEESLLLNKINPSFDLISIIDDNQDTVISDKNCTYDRIIVSKNLSSRSYNPKVFDFSYYNIGNPEDISDHFPVEFHLKF
jgi:endonuclease/exonuclease/phosphatase family metal-dependent hydrolase